MNEITKGGDTGRAIRKMGGDNRNASEHLPPADGKTKNNHSRRETYG
ncbi:hypothetical protein [Lucifera butyrica]|nr:hypothetical protein [Lucifera butyrica]